MLFGSRIIVVIPSYNEAPRIARVLRSMPDYVDHILVVDDASLDNTEREARAAGDSRTQVIVHTQNLGVGAAIVTGYRRAMTLADSPRDAFVVMAGDGQMHPDDMPSLLDPIARGEAGYVKGDRFSWPDASHLFPTARFVGGHFFSKLTSVAIGRPISDSQCGYTALSNEACSRLDLNSLWTGFGYPNDLLSLLTLANVPIKEVCVRPIYADEESKLRVRHLGRIGYIIARAWVRRKKHLRTR